MTRSLLSLVFVLTASGVGTLVARRGPDRFDHSTHATLFPSCVSCHAGAVDAGAALLPSADVACASCHDGKGQRLVTWSPREGPRASNLKFDHAAHPKGGTCLACHADPGSRWMQVRAAAPQGCFACHGLPAEHLAQPDSTCATCHRPLSEAPAALTSAQVARFPAPPSHAVAGFGADGGHAAAARAGDRSCSTCHARDFCAECHLDGAILPSISALGPDRRSLALSVNLRGPASHRRTDFERAHGGQARASIQVCATCHTQPSCSACHATTPRAALTLATHDPRPGRDGAVIRTPPPSHREASWASGHGPPAAARPQSCAACHARSDCLDCHRPGPAGGANGYHPTGFLVSHPAQAYGRQSSCADCHNTQAFCQDCHRQSGVVASARLLGGFHDSKQAFVLGHGQAARQSLESCVSCHAERDCLACHSATRGRGFNPHGPGFNADRLKRKNPGLCVACHATTP
ncbi:MAG: cytochrome c3 family protein [Gemmatimonadota bacterium]